MSAAKEKQTPTRNEKMANLTVSLNRESVPRAETR